jgi:hypothetical protein
MSSRPLYQERKKSRKKRGGVRKEGKSCRVEKRKNL